MLGDRLDRLLLTASLERIPPDDGHHPGGLAKESPESGVWGPSNDTLGAPPDMWYTDRHVYSIRARLGYLGRDVGVSSKAAHNGTYALPGSAVWT